MRNLRTEEEIISHWKGDIDQPVVSICCITYNHEAHIEDALDGFFIQRTDFPYEILIHDDASNDRTADIVRKYEARYPRLIKPIYQTINQYSKGTKINPAYNFPRVKGEFVALCEGDDFWSDENKLAKQVHTLSQLSQINIAFHPARIFARNEATNQKKGDYGTGTRVFSSQVVFKGGGGFMPTPSVMFRRKVLNANFYDLVRASPVGDYAIQVGASLGDGAIFMPDVMAVYRTNVIGSWTSSIKDFEKWYQFQQSRLKLFRYIAEKIPELKLQARRLILRTLLSNLKAATKCFVRGDWAKGGRLILLR